MNTNRILIIAWFLTALIIIIVIGSYIINFHDQSISNNSEYWGQFGDYIGGLLNPVLSLINLVVLTYISISLARIEQARSEWTLQELARPLGQIICGDYENLIQVKFKNCGLGPLIISKITVIHNKGEKYDSLIDRMPNLPDGLNWSDFIIDGIGFTVAKDTEINVIKLEGIENNPVFIRARDIIRNTLKNYILEIEYKDLYGREMPSEKRNLNLFGRHKQNKAV